MNEKEAIKVEILDEFFAMRGNSKPKERVTVTKKIDSFLYIYNEDEQMQDLKRLVRAYRHTLEYSNYQKPTSFVDTIFDRLLKEGTPWDFYDTRIAIASIGMSWDYKAVLKLSNIITKELELYKYHSDYNYMIMALFMNITSSLSRIRLQLQLKEEDLKNVNEAFNYCIDKIGELDKTYKHPYTESHLFVKKGIYYKDSQLIDKGLNLAKSLSNKNIYKMLKRTVKDAHGYINFGMSSLEYNTKIGQSINDLRKDHGYTRLQLANKIGVSHALIAAMERGQRTLVQENRIKLMKVFNCSEDALSIKSKEVNRPLRSEKEKILHFINTSSSNLEQEDMEIIAFILHVFNKKSIRKFIERMIEIMDEGEKMDDNPSKLKK